MAAIQMAAVSSRLSAHLSMITLVFTWQCSSVQGAPTAGQSYQPCVQYSPYPSCTHAWLTCAAMHTSDKPGFHKAESQQHALQLHQPPATPAVITCNKLSCRESTGRLSGTECAVSQHSNKPWKRALWCSLAYRLRPIHSLIHAQLLGPTGYTLPSLRYSCKAAALKISAKSTLKVHTTVDSAVGQL